MQELTNQHKIAHLGGKRADNFTVQTDIKMSINKDSMKSKNFLFIVEKLQMGFKDVAFLPSKGSSNTTFHQNQHKS